MATKKSTFTAVHPIRHHGKLYDRGAKIPTEKFTDDESARLIKHGVLSDGSRSADTSDEDSDGGV